LRKVSCLLMKTISSLSAVVRCDGWRGGGLLPARESQLELLMKADEGLDEQPCADKSNEEAAPAHIVAGEEAVQSVFVDHMSPAAAAAACCCCLLLLPAAAACCCCLLLLLLPAAAWQSGDWKHARRWRLLVVDSGSISFADLYFRRQQQAAATRMPGHLSASCLSSSRTSDLHSCLQAAAEGVSYAVSSVDKSRSVADHVVLLTWPPDGRYSPLRHMAMPGQHSSHQHDRYRWSNNSSGMVVEDESTATATAATAAASDGGDGAHSGAAFQWQQQRMKHHRKHTIHIRALVAPLRLRPSSSSSSSSSSGDELTPAVSKVLVSWGCSSAARSVHSISSAACGSRDMQPVGRPIAAAAAGDPGDAAAAAAGGPPYALSSPQLFGLPGGGLTYQEVVQCCAAAGVGSAAAGVGQAAVLLLQVTVTDELSQKSTSELRPVQIDHLFPGSLNRPATEAATGARGGREDVGTAAAAAAAAAAAVGDPKESDGADAALPSGHLPLPASVFEQFLIIFDGPQFALLLFFVPWAVQLVLLLLLPR
jgi:hypothetical protein